MFWALLCPSSGAHDYTVDYHVSFCKDGRGSVDVKLRLLVLYVRCEVLCRSVVLDNLILGNQCPL